jgi:hypothetical protein
MTCLEQALSYQTIKSNILQKITHFNAIVKVPISMFSSFTSLTKYNCLNLKHKIQVIQTIL